MNAFKGLFIDDRQDHSEYAFIGILFLYCYQKYNSPQRNKQNNKTYRQAASCQYYLLVIL